MSVKPKDFPKSAELFGRMILGCYTSPVFKYLERGKFDADAGLAFKQLGANAVSHYKRGFIKSLAKFVTECLRHYPTDGRGLASTFDAVDSILLSAGLSHSRSSAHTSAGADLHEKEFASILTKNGLSDQQVSQQLISFFDGWYN